MNSTAVKPPVAPTKLCHLIKRPDFEGYGFNLHSEKLKPGQFIGKVDAGSPAENAGLKKGDRIVEVNGVSIGNETHKQVVQRIKAIENEVRLLLIDVDGLTPTTVESLQKQTPDGINIDENDGRAGEGITHISNNNNNKNRSNDETSTKTQNQHHNNNNNDKNLSNSSLSTLSTTITTNTTTTTTTVVPTTITSSSASSQQQQQHNNNGNTLHLPLTAAEMRAKLMSKKKYDPKSESVDIKKKFQIIQTL